MSSEPRLAAPCMAVSPIELTALTSSPRSTHSCTASSRAVGPFVVGLIDHPVHAGRGHQRRRAARRWESSGRRPWLEEQLITVDVAASAARMNGVCPVKSTHSSEPVIGSICRRMGGDSLVARVHVGALVEQHLDQLEEAARDPRCSRTSLLSTSMFRASTAAHSGVRPYQSTALMLAPRSTRSSATSGWLLRWPPSSGVMPFASVWSMSAPGVEQQPRRFEPAVARRVDERRHRAGNRGSASRARGSPPRTMPMPWPKPGTELGSTHCGASPVRVWRVHRRALREEVAYEIRDGWRARPPSAPTAGTSRRARPPWRRRSTSASTAVRPPMAVPSISGVSPAASVAFTSAPPSSEQLDHRRVGVLRGQRHRRHAVAGDRLGRRRRHGGARWPFRGR